jgi:hypothetical protein
MGIFMAFIVAFFDLLKGLGVAGSGCLHRDRLQGRNPLHTSEIAESRTSRFRA